MTILSRLPAMAAALAALMLAPATAQAADAEGNFAVRGYGARICSTYLSEMADPGHASQYGSWVMGYMSARNRLQSDTFDILPFPDGLMMLQAISAVCADRKDATVETAASEVIRAIAPLHQRASSGAVTIERGGQSVRVRQAALSALQAKLSEKRLYTGPDDGRWNEKLGVAVQEFQLREGLVATGLPDLATLIRAIIF